MRATLSLVDCGGRWCGGAGLAREVEMGQALVLANDDARCFSLLSLGFGVGRAEANERMNVEDYSSEGQGRACALSGVCAWLAASRLHSTTLSLSLRFRRQDLAKQRPPFFLVFVGRVSPKPRKQNDARVFISHRVSMKKLVGKRFGTFCPLPLIQALPSFLRSTPSAGPPPSFPPPLDSFCLSSFDAKISPFRLFFHVAKAFLTCNFSTPHSLTGHSCSTIPRPFVRRLQRRRPCRAVPLSQYVP